MEVVQIARIVHELNRVYCQEIGDFSQKPWVEAEQWQIESAITGVRFHLENPDAGPSASHESWLKQKQADGWVFGKFKDPDAKRHPCMVPFEELPLDQQVKDSLFASTVKILSRFLVDNTTASN